MKTNISRKDKIYFLKARSASKLSDFGKVNIGCIAVYKKCVIGVGYNTTKTSPIQLKYDKYRELDTNNGVEPKHSLHAEIMCLNSIKTLDIDFSKVKLYVYREDMNGNLSICKPCRGCQKAIEEFGIKEVFYTDYNTYKKL